MPSPQPPFLPQIGGDLVTDAEREGLARAGYGGGSTALMQRPALLVVDVTWGFCGRQRAADLAVAVDRYPHASGRVAWEAVPRITHLVTAARVARIPIMFTRPAKPAERAQGRTRWEDKNRRHRDVPADAFDLVPDIGASADDPVLAKETPSAFFGTPLRRWLTRWNTDGVVLCGGTTSGCVRATAVDAFAHDLAVTVAADATFDRLSISHRTSLLDLELKYGEVSSVAQIVRGWEAAGETAASGDQDVPGGTRGHGGGGA